jgi:UDP-GlcNAc:undecaprenyl-phosphate GlcNAc-1-phosphate transferase
MLYTPAILIVSFFVLNLFLVLKYRKIAKIVNIFDYPGLKRKIHNKKTPLIGGVIVIINIFVFSIFYFFFDSNLPEIKSNFDNKFNYLIFFFTALALFVVGIYDDKKNLNATLKLALLFFIYLILINLDNELLIKSLRFSIISYEINLGKYSYAFTILCYVLFTNACNMFDGINTQSCSFFLIYFIFLVFFIPINIFLAMLLIVLISLLYLNFDGKIFLGDSGIYLLSFIFSYMSVKYYNNALIPYSELICIVMLIPGLDMLRLFSQRILNQKNPFVADKLHMHHLLLSKYGYSKAKLFIITILAIPIVLIFFNIPNTLIIAFLFLLYFLVFVSLYKKN